MKAGRYRELFNGIDTDRSADNKIKNHLLYNRKSEENTYQINKELLKRGKPVYLAFRKISNLRHAIPSVAFMMILAIVLIGTRASLLNKDITPGTDAEVSDNSDIPNEAAPETAESPAVSTEDTLGLGVNTTISADNSGKTENGFYAALFDVIANDNVKIAIPNLIVRFQGTLDIINPDDFTDIVLTKDGIPVDNGITMTDRKEQFTWGNEPVTDFYFAFDFKNIEPGQYGLTGKYMGVPFNVFNKILEAEVTDEPADPADFSNATFVGHSEDSNYVYSKLTELAFSFKGQQNAFYPSDLTDLVITCDGQEVPFSYADKVYRYYESNPNNSKFTMFCLILNDPLTQSGGYIITGKYKGVSFTSNIINIPEN